VKKERKALLTRYLICFCVGVGIVFAVFTIKGFFGSDTKQNMQILHDAFVAAGALLIANWDTVKEVAANLGSFLSEKFNAMKEAVGNAMTAIGTGVSEKWDAVKQTTSEVMTNVGTTISNTYNAAKEAVTNAMSSMGDMVKGKLDNIKTAYEENGGGIKGIVSATMTALKEYWTLGLDAINTLTGGALDKVKSTIDTGFNAAKTTVLNIMDSIAQGISNAWNAVRSAIKLPHFSISGEFSINPPKVPKLSVEWYAKAMDNGMILKSPTIFGMGGGSLLGAGESGSETIVGTNSLMNMIKNAVGETVNNYGGVNVTVYGAPGQSEEKLAEIISRRINSEVARKGAAWA
jgi:phage-related minor tail protein